MLFFGKTHIGLCYQASAQEPKRVFNKLNLSTHMFTIRAKVFTRLIMTKKQLFLVHKKIDMLPKLTCFGASGSQTGAKASGQYDCFHGFLPVLTYSVACLKLPRACRVAWYPAGA